MSSLDADGCPARTLVVALDAAARDTAELTQSSVTISNHAAPYGLTVSQNDQHIACLYSFLAPHGYPSDG